MLRRTRVLLAAAIAVIVAAVAVAYVTQRAWLARQAPPKPKLLPENTKGAATGWVWSKSEGGRTKVEVRAQSFRHIDEHLELENVDLKLYREDHKSYDHVRCARARFDQDHGTLYSDGDVEITMAVPIEGVPRGRLVSIRTSGVTFEAQSGRSWTERAAAFTFEQGDGKCVGASYDPSAGELTMSSAVELHWAGRGPKSKPMQVEADGLTYKERDAVVLLWRRSRLTRQASVLEGTDSIVNLRKGAIEKVEVMQAHGTERSPGRELEYAADHLWMDFAEKGELKKVTATTAARAAAITKAGRTAVSADRIDLEFEPRPDESVLKQALAMGKAVVESTPSAGRPNAAARPETRIVRSEIVKLAMRPDGREVQLLETDAPGRLEFVPNGPGQRRRTLDADRMRLEYAAGNLPRVFLATKASTRTEPEKKGAAAVLTWSDDLKAEFDAKGELARIEQWNNFRYEEGERRGRAHRAILEQTSGRIQLEQNARFQDASGSVSADRIELAQAAGDVIAEGNVVSTRMPDRTGKSSAMLTADEAIEARAKRMTTAQRNRNIRYEGGAVVWQGANRVAADTIDIDRIARSLAAKGHVRTQFVEQQKDPKARSAAPGFVVVESAALTYREEQRLAHYTGGVSLTRPGMAVKAAEIRAFLTQADSDSSLDRAYADGGVEILRTLPDRSIRGHSEHSEYYAAEQKIILTGGTPTLEDSLRGTTRGRELIYYSEKDKLLVNGGDKTPVVSRIKRSSK